MFRLRSHREPPATDENFVPASASKHHQEGRFTCAGAAGGGVVEIAGNDDTKTRAGVPTQPYATNQAVAT